MLYNLELPCTSLYNLVLLPCSALYRVVLRCTALSSYVPPCTTLKYLVLRSTAVYYGVPRCTTLYYLVLHSTTTSHYIVAGCRWVCSRKTSFYNIKGGQFWFPDFPASGDCIFRNRHTAGRPTPKRLHRLRYHSASGPGRVCSLKNNFKTEDFFSTLTRDTRPPP